MTERLYHTIHAGSFRPHGPDENMAVRKRGSAAVAFTPSRIDFTNHRFIPSTDVFHSPRISHRPSVRFYSRNSKNRFHVAKVEEDSHDDLSIPGAFGSPKVEIMPAIKEQEIVPLLSRKSHEV